MQLRLCNTRHGITFFNKVGSVTQVWVKIKISPSPWPATRYTRLTNVKTSSGPDCKTVYVVPPLHFYAATIVSFSLFVAWINLFPFQHKSTIHSNAAIIIKVPSQLLANFDENGQWRILFIANVKQRYVGTIEKIN